MPAVLSHLNMHHRGSDALDRADDGARVGIKQLKVGIPWEIALPSQWSVGNSLSQPIKGSHGMWMLAGATSIPGRVGTAVQACYQIFTQHSSALNTEVASCVVSFADTRFQFSRRSASKIQPAKEKAWPQRLRRCRPHHPFQQPMEFTPSSPNHPAGSE